MNNKPRNVYVVYHVFTRDFVSAYSSEAKAKAACSRLNDCDVDLAENSLVIYKYKRLTVL